MKTTAIIDACMLRNIILADGDHHKIKNKQAIKLKKLSTMLHTKSKLPNGLVSLS